MTEKLLSVDTVARRLNCSPSNVYKLIGSGRMLCVRCGPRKGYAIPESEVARFITEQVLMLAESQ